MSIRPVSASCNELSVALNKKMHELQQKKDAGVPIVDPRTDTGAASGTAAIGRDTGNAYTGTVAWFKLFRHMDDDGSGRITYAELSAVIREELRVSTREVPETHLRAVWAAIDADQSGSVDSLEHQLELLKLSAESEQQQRQRGGDDDQPRDLFLGLCGGDVEAACALLCS